jgi:ATP-dependent DNA ligase
MAPSALFNGYAGIHVFDQAAARRRRRCLLYAFDCLAYDGDDLCRLPLHLHKTNLAQLLRGRAEGICRMGLEGLVSKHRERAYRGGRCDHWVKVKNRKHPAFSRVADQF